MRNKILLEKIIDTYIIRTIVLNLGKSHLWSIIIWCKWLNPPSNTHYSAMLHRKQMKFGIWYGLYSSYVLLLNTKFHWLPV